MKKKMLSTFLCIAVSLAVFAGCGPGSETEKGGEKDSGPDTSSEKDPAKDTGSGEAADTKNAKEAFDYHQFFQDKINEIYTKVKNGDTEPKFQIGALSLSQKEWNKFLEEYDEIQDIIREMMREEQEKREAERLQKEILEETAGSGMTKWEPVIG